MTPDNIIKRLAEKRINVHEQMKSIVDDADARGDWSG